MKYRYIFIVLILIAFISDSECAWRIGGDVNLFPATGNLRLKKPVIEYGVSLIYENQFGAIYQAAISQFEPSIKHDSTLSFVGMTTLWLLRSAGFKVWRIQSYLSTGAGISRVIMWNDNGRAELGVLSFRADLLVEVWKKSTVTVLTGLSYRGCPLRDSGWYTDRFGLALVIVGSRNGSGKTNE
ncbi:MAG: hypothetical protein P9X24_10190 [Candidatus Hatepunaea meridiana]|nr:hypothetical protein [Candidatus Hatepunaea meridiana]